MTLSDKQISIANFLRENSSSKPFLHLSEYDLYRILINREISEYLNDNKYSYWIGLHLFAECMFEKAIQYFIISAMQNDIYATMKIFICYKKLSNIIPDYKYMCEMLTETHYLANYNLWLCTRDEKYLLKGIELLYKEDDKVTLCENYSRIAKHMFDNKDYKSAIRYIEMTKNTSNDARLNSIKSVNDMMIQINELKRSLSDI